MRAQCCICQELFENDSDVNIAATPCGHTFHEHCLAEWLKSSSTCPRCRDHVNHRSVISKLFFDQADDTEEGGPDPAKLQNQLDTLRVQLRQKDKEIEEAEEGGKSLAKKLKDAEKSNKKIEQLFKTEQSANSSLRKQLEYHQAQSTAVQYEREEVKMIRKRLVNLQNMENLLEGCESDAQEIISATGESNDAATLLARQCAMLKREYEKVKSDKRSLKDELDKCRKELILKSRSLQDRTKELAAFTEQYSRSEEDLKNAEREKGILKKKLSHLKRAIRSPCTTGSSSFVETLMEVSPMLSSTPVRLDKPMNNCEMIDLCLTPDVVKSGKEAVPSKPGPVKRTISSDDDTENYDDSFIIPPSPNAKVKKDCEANEIKYVKISSASASHNPQKKVKREMQDLSNMASTIGSMNIFKKKGNVDYGSVTRKGYNGLGGHVTFTQLNSGSKPLFKKPTQVRSKTVIRSAKDPALPTLDGFLNPIQID